MIAAGDAIHSPAFGDQDQREVLDARSGALKAEASGFCIPKRYHLFMTLAINT